MKRSRHIRLVLLGSASALALAACDQADDFPKNAKFFSDPAQCEAEIKGADCKKAFEESRDAHVKAAPKFATLQECQAKFGDDNCTAAPAPAQGQETATASSGSFFMPLMMGYMMGKMGNGFASQPVYRDAQNTAYAGGGKSAGQAIGRFGQGATAGRAASNIAVARGGFGEAGQTSAS